MSDQPTTPGPGGGNLPPLGPSASTASQRIGVIIEAAEKAAAGIIEDAEEQARRYLMESRRRADEAAAERTRAISDLTDSLVARAEIVKRHSDELIDALDTARTRMGDSTVGVEESQDAQAPGAEQPSPQAPGPRLVPHLQAVDAADGGSPVSSPPLPAETGPISIPSPAPESSPPPEPSPPPEAAPTSGGPSAARTAASPAEIFAGAEPSAGARLLATQMAVAGSSRQEIVGRLENEFGIPDAKQMLDSILGPARD